MPIQSVRSQHICYIWYYSLCKISANALVFAELVWPTLPCPIESISPQATGRRNILRRLGPVRYPSEPATISRQSRDISSSIAPASTICAGFSPNVMQCPIRLLASDSHRGLSEAAAAPGEPGDSAFKWECRESHANGAGATGFVIFVARSSATASLLRIVPALAVCQQDIEDFRAGWW